MDEMMVMGTPWLDKPMALHAYREFECQFNDTALCEYESGHWRFWYQSDWTFGLSTIYLFMATIILFAIGRLFDLLAPASIKSNPSVRRLTAVIRFLSYKAYRIRALNWNSASLGVLALGAVGTIYFFAMTLAPKPYYWPNTKDINFGGSPPIATRSGWLSLACLPFVFATAGKSNLITLVTGVSHEKLQVFHRWISYAFLVTALIHTFPFIVYNIKTGTMVSSWNTTVFYWTGVVALIAQAYLTFASISPLRSMSYEWFKFSHFLAALVFVLFLFFHVDHTLSGWDYFIATGVLFSLSWLHRQVRIYFEHGIGHQARVSLAANGFVCVRIPTNATWGVGQHFFVRFLSLGMHMGSIHPFTACSLPASGSSFDTKTSELVLYIRPRGGLTGRLARLAETQANSTVRVLLDGPYGGVDAQKIVASQRQLIIAGGSGAGWVIPMLTAFLRMSHDRTDQEAKDPPTIHPRSAKVILATRDVSTQGWFEETIKDLLLTFGLEKVPAGLQIELHYTGSDPEASTETTHRGLGKLEDDTEKAAQYRQEASADRSDSESGSDIGQVKHVKHFNARPNLRELIRANSASTSQGQLGVFVCGPLSMQSDVSNAVADAQIAIMKGGAEKDVYLHMEHFSWA